MTLDTKPWDSGSHLKTREDVVEYLAAAIEAAGDDPAFITHALGVVARAEGMSELARRSGVSRRGLYKALAEDGNPSFATVYSVLRSLGIRIRPERA